MRSTELELPGARYRLINESKLLADKPKQLKEWCVREVKSSIPDQVEMYIDRLVYLPCEDKPPDAIGVVFRNYEELVYVNFLSVTLLRALKTLDRNQSDKDYLNSPLWDDVVEAAKQAYAVLMKDEDLEALAEAERNRVIPSNDNTD